MTSSSLLNALSLSISLSLVLVLSRLKPICTDGKSQKVLYAPTPSLTVLVIVLLSIPLSFSPSLTLSHASTSPHTLSTLLSVALAGLHCLSLVFSLTCFLSPPPSFLVHSYPLLQHPSLPSSSLVKPKCSDSNWQRHLWADFKAEISPWASLSFL